MALKWYCCKNCGTAIKKDSSPSSSGCPSKSFHSWTTLAEVGDTNYQCRYCGLTVQTKNSPSSSGCSSSTFHSWTRM